MGLLEWKKKEVIDSKLFGSSLGGQTYSPQSQISSVTSSVISPSYSYQGGDIILHSPHASTKKEGTISPTFDLTPNVSQGQTQAKTDSMGKYMIIAAVIAGAAYVLTSKDKVAKAGIEGVLK